MSLVYIHNQMDRSAGARCGGVVILVSLVHVVSCKVRHCIVLLGLLNLHVEVQKKNLHVNFVKIPHDSCCTEDGRSRLSRFV